MDGILVVFFKVTSLLYLKVTWFLCVIGKWKVFLPTSNTAPLHIIKGKLPSFDCNSIKLFFPIEL